MAEQTKNGPYAPATDEQIEKWQVQVDYGAKYVVGPIARDELGAILARLAASEGQLVITQLVLCQALAILPDPDGARETPRDVAARIMPDVADRLFPPGKVDP